MKVDRWIFSKGEQVVFYVSETPSVPSSVVVNCYSPGVGKFTKVLKLLEPDIYIAVINFKELGKHLLTFYEDSVRTLVVLVTVVIDLESARFLHLH